ncbi:hypothetical protein [Nakamurella endophytica]|uniref:hypothetical protein n=1 Tax=Nakamurella endophytica TaxID=1748367 RepID=UPI00166E7932|nr:hypothetical protein [Nakamurella endophytica]
MIGDTFSAPLAGTADNRGFGGARTVLLTGVVALGGDDWLDDDPDSDPDSGEDPVLVTAPVPGRTVSAAVPAGVTVLLVALASGAAVGCAAGVAVQAETASRAPAAARPRKRKDVTGMDELSARSDTNEETKRGDVLPLQAGAASDVPDRQVRSTHKVRRFGGSDPPVRPLGNRRTDTVGACSAAVGPPTNAMMSRPVSNTVTQPKRIPWPSRLGHCWT